VNDDQALLRGDQPVSVADRDGARPRALVEGEDEGVRAVRIHAKQDIRTEQVPSPEPDASEVRLRVGYVGICGSDLHYYADGAAGIFALRTSRPPEAVTPVATTTALLVLPSRAGAADVEVGGVEEHIRESCMVQRTAAERGHDLIEAGTDARHLRLRDPRIDAEGDDEIFHRACRDPVHVSLHHHRIQGLVDPPPRLQDHREERAFA
jgi:hypothetical protein